MNSLPISGMNLLISRCVQGRNEGGKGAQFPGCQFTMEALNHCRGAELLLAAPKNPNNATSTFFNTVNLPSKELRFDLRGAKL